MQLHFSDSDNLRNKNCVLLVNPMLHALSNIEIAKIINIWFLSDPSFSSSFNFIRLIDMRIQNHVPDVKVVIICCENA